MSEKEKWVIITGASSGIGKALVFEFAKNGFNIFLTARNENTLIQISEKCQSKFRIKTEVFSADLADSNSTDNLIKTILNRRFDILVNNAGFGVKGNFAETNIDEELKMLDVQLAAILKLTKAVLPKMLEAKSGKILNVASVYSFAPVPKQAVYSASKSFILNFSAALLNELKKKNIQVSVLCPGITQTEFRLRAGIKDKKNSGMTAEKVAEIAVHGTLRGRFLIVPGLQNKLFVLIAKYLPTELFATVMRFINDRRGVNQDLQ
ncbi:MAG TPA: SDR family oxidoreductase [Pyrinomonadaceae bacterium]|nr:SDR family oxidoreductase [Pyrinomonadaceae bacterium]